MSISVCHKRQDSMLAYECFNHLQAQAVDCHLDELHDSITDAEDLTSHFLGRVKKCSHLVVVVTESTGGNWWVPFAIGAASALEKRICAAATDSVQRPDFLTKWPRLNPSNPQDWILYAHAYRHDVTSGFIALDSAPFSISTAAQFHHVMHSFNRHRDA
jgi:hypothetical protein